jgi:hypothetical protein
VTVTALGGFSGAVSLSVVSGLPAGLAPTFVPTSLTSGTSTLTISAAKRLGKSTSTFTVTGVSGSINHSVLAKISTR